MDGERAGTALTDLLSVLQWGFGVFARASIAGNEKIAGLLHERDKGSVHTTVLYCGLIRLRLYRLRKVDLGESFSPTRLLFTIHVKYIGASLRDFVLDRFFFFDHSLIL